MYEGVREGLAIEVGTEPARCRCPGVAHPGAGMQWRDFPKALRVDNGPEFIAGIGRLVLRAGNRVAALLEPANRIRTRISNDSTAPIVTRH